MNIRHNIDPTLVKANVERKVSKYGANRLFDKARSKDTIEAYKKMPEQFSGPRDEAYFDYIDPLYDNWIEQERTYYAKVRVIRIAPRKYILVYGNANDKTVKSGTGPFKTLREAKAWFLNGGR